MAEAAPSLATVAEPSESECSICHEFFTDPKLLPCGHHLCCHCLVSWLGSQAAGKCPLCRSPIGEQPEPGAKAKRMQKHECEALATSLPTDLALVALVEADRLLKKDHQCCICEDDVATSLCLNCGDLFCNACNKVHTKQKLLRDHVVQDLNTLTPDQLTSQRTSLCQVHPNKACELYCPSHDVAMCHVCAMSRHRSCPDVTDLQQKAEESRAELQQLADKLRKSQGELDFTIGQLEHHLQDTEKKTETALSEMETACENLKSVIDSCFQKAEKQARGKFSETTATVQDGKALLLQQRGSVTSHTRAVQRVQKSKSSEAVIAMTTVLKKRMSQLDLRASLPDNDKLVSRISFSTDPEVLSRLRSVLEKELSDYLQSTTVPADIFAIELRFHANHGSSIVLSDDQKTARKKLGWGRGGGIVMGCQPIKLNTLYEVCLDKREPTCRNYMFSGVIEDSPHTVTLPDSVNTSGNEDGWPDAIVISYKRVIVRGRKTPSDVGMRLHALPEQSRLGVLLDEKRNLHLYINGEDQGVAAQDVADPCYPFFEVYGPYTQVTALPVTTIEE